jgi:hypothetical protein
MNKMAVFVEGLTEQIFVEKLITEIAGEHKIAFETKKAYGGKSCPRRLITLNTHNTHNNLGHYVLLVDSSTDNRVSSDVRDNYDSLINNGYTIIIGIQDLYPLNHNELQYLQQGLEYKIKTIPVKPMFIVSVMEIEAWFLSDYNHFQYIHPDLTMHFIQQCLGFNPRLDNMENRVHPSEDLHNIYYLKGFSYNKHESEIQRTVDVLDYAFMYLCLNRTVAPLSKLVGIIDAFLS